MFSKLKSLREYFRVFLADNRLLFDGIRQRRGANAKEYLLRRNIHRLEKGLRNPECRIPFGQAYAGQTERDFETYRSQLPPAIADWGDHVLAEYRQRHANPALPVEAPADVAIPLDAPDYASLRAAFAQRTSCRHFIAPAPAGDAIAEILHDTRHIPTSCNREAYRVLIVETPEKRDWLLANSIGLTNFTGVEHCTVLAFVADLAAVNHPRDRHVPVMDCSFASLLFALAAQSRGLATCYLNWPIRPNTDRQSRTVLNLPTTQKIVFCLLVGHQNPALSSGKSPKSGRICKV